MSEFGKFCPESCGSFKQRALCPTEKANECWHKEDVEVKPFQITVVDRGRTVVETVIGANTVFYPAWYLLGGGMMHQHSPHIKK